MSYRPLAIVLCAITLAQIGAPVAASTPGFYVSDTSAQLWRLDIDSGLLTLIGTIGIQMNDIAASPSGDLFGVGSNGNLYTIDGSTAAPTFVGATGVPAVSGLEFASNGSLFLANAPSATAGTLYTVNINTGIATSIGPIGFASNGDLAFDAEGHLFMTASNFTTAFNLVSVDPTTGAGTLIGPHGFGSLPAMDFAGPRLIGVNAIGQVIELNSTTGVGSLVSNTSPSIAASGAACVRKPGDIDGDGLVNVDDLLALLGSWGACPPPRQGCPADVSPWPAGDGQVNVDDLLMVLGNWG